MLSQLQLCVPGVDMPVVEVRVAQVSMGTVPSLLDGVYSMRS